MKGTGKVWFKDRKSLYCSSKFEAQRRVEDNVRQPPTVYTYNPVVKSLSHKCLVTMKPSVKQSMLSRNQQMM